MSNHVNEIEAMVDQVGIKGVLTALEKVCNLKAQHVEENWQDDRLSWSWTQDANRIGGLIARITN